MDEQLAQAMHSAQFAAQHLQNIGKVAAKPAEQIKAGDVLVWNFGSTSEVLAVERTAKTVVVKLSGGYSRRFGASRLVAVQ